MSNTDRKYDIVLWGATGFTGQLVAEYYANRYGAGEIDWAIAGRNEEKLKSLRDRLSQIDADLNNLPIEIGDAFDRESLGNIAERSEVICSTVGPYARYGNELVSACVEAGTNYCDLTGEVHWMQKTIDKYHETALGNETRIVHSCGFDSIPSDIGTLLLQTKAQELFGAPCSRIKSFVKSSSFELSGGTIASIVETFEAASDNPQVARALRDPDALVSAKSSGEGNGSLRKGPSYAEEIEQWTAPFIMAMTNEKVVRRSHSLMNYPWGEDFTYSESLPTGSGITGWTQAVGISGIVAVMMGSLSVGPLRKFLDKFILPESGDGPDRETIENSYFKVYAIGKGTSSEGEPLELSVTIEGDRDPGYGATAWMLGESAYCLAKEKTNTSLPGGVLTPATGIGLPIVDRLEETGMEFDVEEGN